MVFGISFEGDFGIAISALKVKPKDLDAKIGLLIANLHPHIEFGSNVKIVGTCIASQAHGQHISDHHQLVLATTSLDDDLVVEILREILDYHLPFCHSFVTIIMLLF